MRLLRQATRALEAIINSEPIGAFSRIGLGRQQRACGNQVWAHSLKSMLTELLGPPAKEDYAPPPSGNPRSRGRQ